MTTGKTIALTRRAFVGNISPSNEHPGPISFRMDWLDLLAVQGTLKSLLQHSMNTMKRQKDSTLKDELPRSVDAQCAIGDQWKNNSIKNEVMEPKQKQHPVVDGTGDRSKVRRCKEQYCIGTWNVRSTNQGKLEVVKQEMARVNVDILGISELKWTGKKNGLEWVNLTQMTIISTTVGRHPFEEME